MECTLQRTDTDYLGIALNPLRLFKTRNCDFRYLAAMLLSSLSVIGNTLLLVRHPNKKNGNQA